MYPIFIEIISVGYAKFYINASQITYIRMPDYECKYTTIYTTDGRRINVVTDAGKILSQIPDLYELINKKEDSK